MKKYFERIIGIIIVLIIGYQQFCYADVIDINPIVYFIPIFFFIGFIGIIVLITTAISYFLLIAISRKQNEAKNVLDNEEIEREKNSFQRRFYIWGMILAIVGLILLELSGEISEIMFFMPLFLFVISFIIRLMENKRLSNIICKISIVLICSIGVWVGMSNKMINDYNKQFTKYQKESDIAYGPQSVSDVEGLINAVINNNSINKRKVTIIYDNSNYTTTEELNQLLAKINDNSFYEMDTNIYFEMKAEYDSKHDYITYIKLYKSYEIDLKI